MQPPREEEPVKIAVKSVGPFLDINSINNTLERHEARSSTTLDTGLKDATSLALPTLSCGDTLGRSLHSRRSPPPFLRCFDVEAAAPECRGGQVSAWHRVQRRGLGSNWWEVQVACDFPGGGVAA